MNSVHIMGRIVRDLELKYSANGETAILGFTVAVNRKYNKPGEEKQADFISCKAFSKTAENLAKFFKKGSMIALDGRIQTGSYDKEGVKIYTTDVIVDGFHFTGERKADSDTGTTEQVPGTMVDMSDDELPF